MITAPIVLFVYNRPWHTQQTIEALQKNMLVDESELFIYSDAAKTEGDKEKVQAVREYIRLVDGFNKVTIIEREENWGLANSIIDGVTEIVNKYGRIIVLEDDLVTSPYFLKYMNDALEFYQNEDKVWHISGWNVPIRTTERNRAFLWRMMECWGWATWDSRWKYFDKKIAKESCEIMSIEEIRKFNLDGAVNYYDQVLANKDGKINTWAVFWYAIIFKYNGLCVSPSQSLLLNIGLDGTGVNCGSRVNNLDQVLGSNKVVSLPHEIREDQDVILEIKRYYQKKNSMKNRIINKVLRMLGISYNQVKC